MKTLIRVSVSLATLAALWFTTPDAMAQRRGGEWRGGGSRGSVGIGVYVGPRYGYDSSYGYRDGWRGYDSRYYVPYGSQYYGPYRNGFYAEDPYVSVPSTTYESYYPPEPATETAQVRVRVADPNAEIWFNGTATRQRGTERTFVTPPLRGAGNSYEVRARWTNDAGETIERSRTVEVSAGQESVIDFSR